MVIKREMSLNPVVFEEFSGGDGAGGWKESMYACVGVCVQIGVYQFTVCLPCLDVIHDLHVPTCV